MTDLSTTNLREEIAQLNIGAELTYLELAKKLYVVSEEKLYIGWGYETLAEYVKNELQRSKTFCSNILKAGTFLVKNELEPQDLSGTSYARLVSAIRLHPDNAQLALAKAQTLSEDELVHQAKEKKFDKHPFERPEYLPCAKCGISENLHE